MEEIYPVSALVKNQSAVKRAAQRGVVRITEHGAAAYIFCSEDVFNARMREAVEDALYEVRLRMAITQGRADIDAGRTYRGTDAAREEVERRLAEHA